MLDIALYWKYHSIKKGREQNMENNKYPNYEAFAAYLNTFEEPEKILSGLVALLKPSENCVGDRSEKD